MGRPQPATSTKGIPVVGIGASAGGLEALEAFLTEVPARTGMAFVVVQHLDPASKGMLVELLARVSRIPVTQAIDRQKVEADHVYVIRPGHDISLLHGRLHLFPQVSPRGLNRPIDSFFRSLAEDRQEHGIGVILSGTGSDGTLGLRAIKERAGAAFVQSVESAKFDGMPRSAIEAGLADIVAPVEELPRKIFAYVRHVPKSAPKEPVVEGPAQAALEKVCLLLRVQTGNDFSLYKTSTVLRRIERRMGLHQIDDVAHYVRLLRENPTEVELLFKELLIGVTSFFRDPLAWEHLRDHVLPQLVASRPNRTVLRAWVAGCSTGEEAYSLAMVFREAVDPLPAGMNYSLQIFATDLDRQAIEKARQGHYPPNIAADVSPERLDRWFVRDDQGFRVSRDIREMVIFAPQNLTTDPPFTKLDVLTCRNVLIYLAGDLQKRLIPLFHYSLNSGGVLFLGSAETIGGFSSLFSPLDGTTRLFRKMDHALAPMPIDLPSLPPVRSSAEDHGRDPLGRPKSQPPNLQALVDRALVQRVGATGILCGERGDILYISGKAGRYLEPATGKANLNVFAMAREGLRYELSSAFAAATKSHDVVNVRGVQMVTDTGAQAVDVTVQKLTDRDLAGTVMIVITDVLPRAQPRASPRSTKVKVPRRIATLEHDLERAREETQTTREEMQTSQEELKSTNEELQSANEELQSTNEELTTSKEELQSLNEELHTLNSELESKVDELSRSNNDMKNLLNSTDIATLFLDTQLRVRRFTTQVSRIVKLIPSDAGRPITDLVSDVDYPTLADDAREVLRTLVFVEKQAATRDGRWFTIRIMPYRTMDNVIDGVVITFTDASAARALEVALREQTSQLRQMAESLPNLVWGCRADGMCDYLGPQWVDFTGIAEKEQLGYRWLEQVHDKDRDRVREEWKRATREGNEFDSEFRMRRADGSYRWFKCRAVPIREADGTIVKWYGTATDIDDLKHEASSEH